MFPVENFFWDSTIFNEIGQKGEFSEKALFYVELVRSSLTLLGLG